MTISEDLLADFELEAQSTRRVLSAVPKEHFDWKPHQKSMTLSALAGHIVESPGWTHAMLDSEFDFSTLADHYQPFVPETPASLLDTFEEKSAVFHKSFSGRQDEFMTSNWTMKNGDHVILSMPRDKAVRSTVLHHMIHHRGQLTVYLRLLDISVPSTYGPTADEQPPGT